MTPSEPIPEHADRTNGSPSPARIRACAFLGLLLVVTLGLASRTAPMASVPVLGNYFGDATWAAAAYAALRILAPMMRVATAALLALAVAIAVECSQLWHPAWLDALREYRVVALLIGHGFIWLDLVAYAIGVLVASSIELILRKNTTRTT